MIHMADVLDRFLPAYDEKFNRTPQQYKVCRQIEACRTTVLGGFHLSCEACGHSQYLYHACRNRHCPRCQQQASEQWAEVQLSRVVDTTYYHLVFTLPHELNGWVRLHAKVIYALFFQSVWETLNTLGHDPKRLNGQLGMTAVLHTWGQNLSQHVHLHCLLPGGALSEAGHWHSASSTWLFPVTAMSRLFRGKMVSALRASVQSGELSRVKNGADAVLEELMSKDWVVYAKEGISRPDTLVNYLARYTRKSAISESRLLSMDDESVSFSYKDYRDGKQKQMCLEGCEFLRRFLQHILPHGFMRIRHYGWLSNASRKKKLPLVREAIAESEADPPPSVLHKRQPRTQVVEQVSKGFVGIICRKCKTGLMKIDFILLPRLFGSGLP